jgi:GR25 family glycosyltransferase involved in LPS biosynthesis
MEPVLGELGCYLSHVQVMRGLLASAAAAALVLEDDVLLHDSLPAVLQGLMQHPARWDMVKLSAVHSGTPQPVPGSGARPPAGGDAQPLHRQQRLPDEPARRRRPT